MAKQLLGKPVAESVKERLMAQVKDYKDQGKELGFAAIRVGNDEASAVYQERLMKMANTIGLTPIQICYSEETSEEEVFTKIQELSQDASVAGILLFLPLPKGWNEERLVSAIPPEKDVDCLNPASLGQVLIGRSPWAPCTARAVLEILDFYDYEVAGKHVVVVGRSNVVGKPLAQMLTQRHGTVTVCHSKTKDLSGYTQKADLVVMAVGQAGLLKGDMLSPNAWVIDVGINVRPDGQGITGDADFDSCEKVCAAITPVPGGVGTVSVMMVMQALVRTQHA